jgi:hypothetical protein
MNLIFVDHLGHSHDPTAAQPMNVLRLRVRAIGVVCCVYRVGVYGVLEMSYRELRDNPLIRPSGHAPFHSRIRAI